MLSHSPRLTPQNSSGFSTFHSRRFSKSVSARSVQTQHCFRKQRGFIGPIGDDLPSLIPILFGLVIFFSVFTFAFDSFDKGNQAFKLELDGLNIARQMRGSSFVSGYCNALPSESAGAALKCDALGFYQKCAQLKNSVTNLNFLIGLVELPLGLEEKAAGSAELSKGMFRHDFPFFDDPADDAELGQAGISGTGSFACSSVPLDQLEEKNPYDVRGKVIVSLTYPIALQTNHAIQPMRMLVVLWK